MAIKKVTHKNVDEIISQGMTAGSPQTLDVDLTVSAVNRVNDPITGLNQKAAALHTHAINELSDVSTTGAIDGQGLVFFSDVDGLGNPGWKPDTVASTAGATNLDDLNDVTATGAIDGQVLSYNSGTWSPATVTSGGSGATNMEQLSDTDLVTTAPQSEDFLKYNGSQWVPAALPAGGGTSNVANLDDLTDVNAATPGNNQVLAWTGSAWEPANPAVASTAVLSSSGITFDDTSGDNEYVYGTAPQIQVNISSPQPGDALVYDDTSGKWINGATAGSGSLDLGIDVTVSGGNVDYEFNSPTPQGYPSVDTSTLATGSTMMWDGSNWVNSGLIIESYT